MTIHALFLISWKGVHHCPMGEHGASFVGNIEQITMAFFALVVGERCIGHISIFLMIVGFGTLGKMDHDIFDTVKCFGIEKGEGLMGSRQMAIHAIRDEPLAVIDVG
jgi:hypothetical protein